MDATHHRSIDWGLVIALVTIIAGGLTAFIVVREAVANLTAVVAAQPERDRDQDDRIRAIENNRSIEQQLADLKNEVVRLSVLIENRDDKRKR